MNANITFRYKDYVGKATWDAEAHAIVGSIRGIRDDIGFGGVDLQSAYASFETAAESYAALRERVGEPPRPQRPVAILGGLVCIASGYFVLLGLTLLVGPILTGVPFRAVVSQSAVFIITVAAAAAMWFGFRIARLRRKPLLFSPKSHLDRVARSIAEDV